MTDRHSQRRTNSMRLGRPLVSPAIHKQRGRAADSTLHAAVDVLANDVVILSFEGKRDVAHGDIESACITNQALIIQFELVFEKRVMRLPEFTERRGGFRELRRMHGMLMQI